MESVSEAVEQASLLIADIELAQRLESRIRETIARGFALEIFQSRRNDFLFGAVLRGDCKCLIDALRAITAAMNAIRNQKANDHESAA